MYLIVFIAQASGDISSHAPGLDIVHPNVIGTGASLEGLGKELKNRTNIHSVTPYSCLEPIIQIIIIILMSSFHGQNSNTMTSGVARITLP